MTPETKRTLDEHVQEIAKILYEESDESQMTSLAEIEAVVRAQVQEPVTPKLGIFLLHELQTQRQAPSDD